MRSRIVKALLICSFSALFAFIIFLHSLNLSDYQLSIYEKIPLVIWCLPFFSFLFFTYLLLYNKLSNLFFNLTVVGILLTLFIVYAFPYLSNIIFVGTTGDQPTHLGLLNQILLSSKTTSYYPGYIIFGSFICLVTDISIFQFSSWVTILLLALFPLFCYYFVRAYYPESRMASFSIPISGIFCFISIELSLTWLASMILIPIIFGIFFRNYSFSNIFIMMVMIFALTIFHQFTALAVISILLILYIILKLRGESLPYSGVVLSGLIIFLAWNFYYNYFIIRQPLINMINIIFLLSAPDQVSSSPIISADFGLSYIDQLFLISKIYYTFFIFIIIFVTTLILYRKRCRHIFRFHELKYLIIISIIYLIINVIAIVSNIGSFTVRLMSLINVLNVPVIVLFIKQTIENKRAIVKYGALILILFSFIVTSAAVYNSPETTMSRSSQLTESEIVGFNALLAISNDQSVRFIYGESRYYETQVYTDSYSHAFNSVKFQFNLENFYDSYIMSNNESFILSLTLGRIERAEEISVPRDLAFTDQQFSSINCISNSNKIYWGGNYLLYQIDTSQ